MEKEIKRLLELLSNTNPLSEDYAKIIDLTFSVIALEHCLNEKCDNDEMHRRFDEWQLNAPAPTQVPEPCEPNTEQTEEQTEEPTVEPTPVAEPVQEPVVDEGETKEPVAKKTRKKTEPLEPSPKKSDYDYATIRTMLSEVTKRGVQIQPIVAQFIPEGKPIRLSEIPAESYDALVEVINNAG